jgi:hypothetical protein
MKMYFFMLLSSCCGPWCCTMHRGPSCFPGCPFDRLAPRRPRPEARGGHYAFLVMLTFSASVLLSVHSPEPTPIVIYNDRSGLVGVGTYPRAGSPEDRLL